MIRGLGNRLIESILVEFPPGYIFSPFGAYGRAFIIARSSAASVIAWVNFFCYSALPLMAFIAAAGIYSRAVHSPFAFLIAVGLGVVWMAACYLSAKIVTRGHIEYPRGDAGANNAR